MSWLSEFWHRTGSRCWTEPARTRERATVSAATEYDAAFRNDAGGYFLPADASSPAFGRKRSRAVSKIIRCVRNSRARLSSRWPRSSSRPACPRRLGQASRSLRSISKGPSCGTGRRTLETASQLPCVLGWGQRVVQRHCSISHLRPSLLAYLYIVCFVPQDTFAISYCGKGNLAFALP